MNKCHHIFTHKDLDGILSLLIFKWFHPEDSFLYKAVTNLNVEIQIEEHLKEILNVHDIFVFDLALRESFLKFDLPFITFFDHHKRSEPYKKNFKNAKIIHKEFTSNCKFLYNFYQKIKPKDLNKNQKFLILLGDDFDSGENKLKESKDLNILFWNLYRNDIKKFIETYQNGFKDFSEKEKLLINKVKIEAVKFLKTLPIFETTLNIQNLNKKVICSHGETTNLLSLDYMMEKYNSDLVFFINTYNQRISLKQKKSENMVDLGSFAQKYCEGDGNNLSAGGKITDIFMEITKNFKQIV
jgi:oligoribonuclease NrnB/cAMP/cGMP phosphodiesterase (DHH superfamily)